MSKRLTTSLYWIRANRRSLIAFMWESMNLIMLEGSGIRPQEDQFLDTWRAISLLDHIEEVPKKSSDHFLEPEISLQRSIMKERNHSSLLRLSWMLKLLTLHLRIWVYSIDRTFEKLQIPTNTRPFLNQTTFQKRKASRFHIKSHKKQNFLHL